MENGCPNPKTASKLPPKCQLLHFHLHRFCRVIAKNINHTYEAAGEYTVVVKVIDILGNDTTKTVKVKVK